MYYIKAADIWPKISPLAFQLVLRNQRGCVQLGLASE